MVPQTRWGSPLHKEVRASRTLTKVLGRVTCQRSEGVDRPPSPAVSDNLAGSGGLRGSRARSCSRAQSITSRHSRRSGSAQSQVTNDGQETSSESEPSHEEEDAPCEDEDVEAGKGEAEVLSDGQVASDGEEGQGHAQIENTLTGVSNIFGMHKETDAESDTGEKIQSIQWKRRQPSLRRTRPPRTRASHLPRKSSQLTKHSMTRPSKGLDSWTQILMLGSIRRLLKASWAGPRGTP